SAYCILAGEFLDVRYRGCCGDRASNNSVSELWEHLKRFAEIDFRVPSGDRSLLQRASSFRRRSHIEFQRRNQRPFDAGARSLFRPRHFHAHPVAFARSVIALLARPSTTGGAFHAIRRSCRRLGATLWAFVVWTGLDFQILENWLLIVAEHIAIDYGARVAEVRTEEVEHFKDLIRHPGHIVFAFDDA